MGVDCTETGTEHTDWAFLARSPCCFTVDEKVTCLAASFEMLSRLPPAERGSVLRPADCWVIVFRPGRERAEKDCWFVLNPAGLGVRLRAGGC